MIKKIIRSFFVAFCFLFLFTGNIGAQEAQQKVFKAEVIDIIEEQTFTGENGQEFTKQDIKILGKEGEWDEQEIIINGIGDVSVISSSLYEEGDVVLVQFNYGLYDQEGTFYIIDRVRTPVLLWLLGIFFFILVAVARWKGFISFIIMGITALVLLRFVIPQILSGANPLFISLIAGLFILSLAIFGTEGFSKKSYVAYISIVFSLLLMVLLSSFFLNAAQVTGFITDDILNLATVGNYTFDVKGLLLAGIMIGALGVLDDVVMSQVSIVRTLHETKKELTQKELFFKAMHVGVDHINAIVNTLFLAYAGVALPLLLLFSIDTGISLSFEHIINYEAITVEIIRALVGSIVLILTVPICTFIAVKAYKKHT